MDTILLIDYNNALWRANVKFGKPHPHNICSSSLHKPEHPKELHCLCGALWDEEKNDCYTEMYRVIYCFFRNLKPIIEQVKPDKCFIVLDGSPQFRYDLYPEYKANRRIKNASTDHIKTKVYNDSGKILELLKLLPMTIVKSSGFEADDLIGEFAESFKEDNVVVLSNDSDYIQLLQRDYKNISIYNPIKKEFMVAPAYHYIAWKALAGDSSDNIPALLTPAKAVKTISNPTKLRDFLNNQENNFLFQRNRQLIEFKSVPIDNIDVIEGETNYNVLKKEFENMMMKSMTNEKYWNDFIKAFNIIKY